MTVTCSDPPLTEVVAAHRLVKDLFRPTPWRYWCELIVVGGAAWVALLLAVASPSPVLAVVAGVLAVPLWYRATMMLHELTHQNRAELPGFHLAWNLVIGVGFLLPSIMYEGVHNGHHKKTTYGTAADPEYLPLAGRPWPVVRYLGFTFVVFPLMMLRFLVGTPVSWVVPPLRRLLVRSASSYVINLGYARTMSTSERRRLLVWEGAILAAWWPPVALTLAGELSWRWLAVWYAVYTAALFVNRLRMLSAHRFASDGHATDHLGQFADSIDTPSGWWAELWAPLGTRYHALHHLFPTLPFHNLGPAYRRLVAALPADSFYHRSKSRGLFPALVRLLTDRKPTSE